MATLGVGFLGAAGVFTTVPVVGWIVGIAAAVLDATVIQPALQGKQKFNANASRMLDVPVGSNEAGAPRIWAIGRRIRVPTHILWSSEKRLETGTTGSTKRGTAVPFARTYLDALISLNDRKTTRLTQLIGNGKPLIFGTRNFVTIASSFMAVSVVPGTPDKLLLTMSDTFQPDFTDRFAVGNAALLSLFVTTAGADINIGYWVATAVTKHSSTPSTMTLQPASGQSATGVVANAGTILFPGTVTRLDDGLVSATTSVQLQNILFNYGLVVANFTVSNELPYGVIFAEGDKVKVFGAKVKTTIFTPPGSIGFGSALAEGAFTGITFKVLNAATTARAMRLIYDSGVWPPQLLFPSGSVLDNPMESKSASDTIRIIPVASRSFSQAYFPSSFNPAARYHDGSDPQTPDALLESVKGAGNAPAFNGLACQALESLFVNDFGGNLPFALEAMIDPDLGMTWAQAYYEVLRRGGIPAQSIDTSGVSDRTFGGMYLRGAVATSTAMQPMLVAGQHVGQERDGVITVFDIDNADVVQVENGAVFSDMGAHAYGQRDQGDEKLQVEDVADEDLPTSVSIRHQDPDVLYMDGYQHFGLRNPTASTRSNETEINLTNLALTRTESRNLAVTIMRRAYVNRRRFRTTLNACYLHVAENDLLTLTDDSGQVITCRVIQRDIGGDFRVSITALAERTSLAVSGSPVQSGSALLPPVLVSAPALRVIPVDAPGIDNGEVQAPSVKLAVAAEAGTFRGASVWESTDGTNWSPIGSIGTQAVIGSLDVLVASETAAESYGSTTVSIGTETITATFVGDDGHTQLDGATLTDINAGRNWIAMVDSDVVELIGFTTAVDLGEGQWQLGGLYRGLRGTTAREWQVGTQVVILSSTFDAETFTREFVGLSSPQSVAFKVVPTGKTIDDVESIQVVCHWRNVLPLPVRRVTKTIGSSPFDARFTVDAQWCRSVLPLGSQPPHPIDEPYEAYLLTVYDPTGALPVRTKLVQASPASGSTTLRDRWFDYSAAEQTADGYTPSSSTTFVIDIVQVGEFGNGPSIKQTI
jgi:hypothetical protein